MTQNKNNMLPIIFEMIPDLNNFLGNNIGYYDSTNDILHNNDNMVNVGRGQQSNSIISELIVSGDSIDNLIKLIFIQNQKRFFDCEKKG